MFDGTLTISMPSKRFHTKSFLSTIQLVHLPPPPILLLLILGSDLHIYNPLEIFLLIYHNQIDRVMVKANPNFLYFYHNQLDHLFLV